MSERRVQRLFLSKGGVIAIETAEGLITLRSEGGRHFRIEMPKHAVAHRSIEAALSGGRFLRRLDDGKIVPTYQAIVPVVEDGELVGAETVQVVGA